MSADTDHADVSLFIDHIPNLLVTFPDPIPPDPICLFTYSRRVSHQGDSDPFQYFVTKVIVSNHNLHMCFQELEWCLLIRRRTISTTVILLVTPWVSGGCFCDVLNLSCPDTLWFEKEQWRCNDPRACGRVWEQRVSKFYEELTPPTITSLHSLTSWLLQHT
jgi:hypothetical protein